MNPATVNKVLDIVSGALVILSRYLEAQAKIRADTDTGNDVTDAQLDEAWAAIQKAKEVLGDA